MPQMSPLSWLNLFFMFLMIFLFFNILNYYNYKPMLKNSTGHSLLNLNSALFWKW